MSAKIAPISPLFPEPIFPVMPYSLGDSKVKLMFFRAGCSNYFFQYPLKLVNLICPLFSVVVWNLFVIPPKISRLGPFSFVSFSC